MQYENETVPATPYCNQHQWAGISCEPISPIAAMDANSCLRTQSWIGLAHIHVHSVFLKFVRGISGGNETEFSSSLLGKVSVG